MTDKLEHLAELVARQATDLEDSIRQERASGGELLTAVVESIRPALRALSSKLGPTPIRGAVLIHDDRVPRVALVLTEAGQFLRLTGPDTVGAYSWLDLSAEVTALHYPIAECVDAIRLKLEEYASGNAGRTAKKAFAKAEQLRALTVLLKQ
jgi:hypothetical protein